MGDVDFKDLKKLPYKVAETVAMEARGVNANGKSVHCHRNPNFDGIRKRLEGGTLAFLSQAGLRFCEGYKYGYNCVPQDESQG